MRRAVPRRTGNPFFKQLWPHTPQVDHVFLTTNDDGLLVLAGSSSRLNYVAGVVLRPDTHSVKIEAGFYHTSIAAFAPVLTEEALTIAVRAPTPTGVEHVVIPMQELFSQTNPMKGNGKAWGKLPGPPIDLRGVRRQRRRGARRERRHGRCARGRGRVGAGAGVAGDPSALCPGTCCST